MTETTVVAHPAHVTFINVFSVDPERQGELVDVLTAASEQVMSRLPGFISGNFHASLDGTRVVNYTQWEDDRTLRAAQDHPDAQSHMTRAIEIAERIEPNLYEVVAVHHR